MRMIAWELRASSTSGGKRYSIVVADQYLITGFGSVRTPVSSMQWQIRDMGNTRAAHAEAVSVTAAKESKGYTLAVAPVFAEPPQGTDDVNALLKKGVGHRGAHSNLAFAYSWLLNNGQPVNGQN